MAKVLRFERRLNDDYVLCARLRHLDGPFTMEQVTSLSSDLHVAVDLMLLEMVFVADRANPSYFWLTERGMRFASLAPASEPDIRISLDG